MSAAPRTAYTPRSTSPHSSSSTLSPSDLTDGKMNKHQNPSHASEDGEHHHELHAPPIMVPGIPTTRDGGEEVLPAEADLRDRQREEDEPPDLTKDSESSPKKDIEDGKEKDIFDRFSPARKRTILAIVSYSAFISPVTMSIFLPSIPDMAKDLHTTASMINITVAIFLVTIGTAPLFWSPLSGFYGRRPIYLASMPIHVVASIGVARSKTVGDIIGTRILQGIGGSCVLAVGAGSVGDIYRPTERANAMGWFYSGALMGPSLAPIIGGVFTQYTAQTWRSSQYFLAGCGVLSVVLVFFFLPETSHPPLPHDTLKEERGKKFVFYYFNPVGSLGLFRWLNIVTAALVSSCVMLETYCFLVPLSTVFKTHYGINNVAISGCLYLANGGANMIAGRIAGPFCDRLVLKYMEKRGYRRPEDRLRAAVIAAAVVMPLSCLGYGWLIQYGAGGIGPPIVMMMLSAMALMFIFTPLNTYLIDCMQKRGAELIAVNNFLRYIFAAGASALVLPIAEAIGWGLTMTVAAIISWVAAALLLATIRWGHIWREKADKKYGVAGAPDSIERPKQTEEDQEKSRTSEHDGEHGEHGEHGDEPGHLVPVPDLRRTRRNTGQRGISAEGGEQEQEKEKDRLTRQTSGRSDMPPVQEVLKRTVSLSGASVHGA